MIEKAMPAVSESLEALDQIKAASDAYDEHIGPDIKQNKAKMETLPCCRGGDRVAS